MQQERSILDHLIEAGLIPKEHKLNDDDIRVLNRLSHDEVEALQEIRMKLGDEFINKGVKVGYFPSPQSLSF